MRREVLVPGTLYGKADPLGFEAFSAPEVPTIMMNGGCKFPGTSDDHKLMGFESALL